MPGPEPFVTFPCRNAHGSSAAARQRPGTGAGAVVWNDAGMSLQMDIARSHLETLIERLTGITKAIHDEDGDYPFSLAHARFFARVDGDAQPVFRIFVIPVRNVDKSPELLDALNSINTHLVGLRIMWIDRQVLLEADLRAMSADIAAFGEACQLVAATADHFGPALVENFGGEPFFEVSKETGYEPPHPNYVGYL